MLLGSRISDTLPLIQHPRYLAEGRPQDDAGNRDPRWPPHYFAERLAEVAIRLRLGCRRIQWPTDTLIF